MRSRLTLRKIFGFPIFLLSPIVYATGGLLGWPMIYLWYKHRGQWRYFYEQPAWYDINIAIYALLLMCTPIFGWGLHAGPNIYGQYWTYSHWASSAAWFLLWRWTLWSKECDERYLNEQ